MAVKQQKFPNEDAKNIAMVGNLEYNTQRARLLISEYGRNIQKMIQSAIAIEDREQRTKAAHAIVNAMALLNPQVKEIIDYKQKLWDHLFIISDFKIDVDSPYAVPEKAKIKEHPKVLHYPTSNIKYKYYGKVIEDMIRKIADMEDGTNKEQYIQNLANFMKMSYLTWNKDTVDDTTIFSHMNELSKGKIKINDTVTLNHTAEILAMNKEKMQRESAMRKGGGRQNQKNKRRNNKK
jgi:hypothetical protein